MKKIGITGGVGSGKSKVLEYLAEIEGASIYQADILAHEVQSPGTECHKKIWEYFGTDILNMDGTLNRKKLGQIVFSDNEKLLALNAIVHPAVEARILELISQEEEKGCEYFVLEAALLHTPFYRNLLDEIWYIHVTEAVRRERLKSSRNYSDEKITSMIQSQPSECIFNEISHRIIENSGDFEWTEKQLDEAIRKIDLGDR